MSTISIPSHPGARVPGQVRTPQTELSDRLGKVQDSMARRSWAALVVTDPANLFYLTGYDAWSFYTPQCLIVPADGPPHLFARAMDANGAAFTANLPESQVHGYPEALVHRPDCHPFDWIVERARELDLLPSEAGATVAFEGDSAFFSVRGYLSLAAGLDGLCLVDSEELVNWVRLIKSPYEIGQLRIAGSITEQVMRRALDEVGIGRRHCDAVSEILRAQAMGTPENGGDYPAIVPLLPTGDSSGTPHLTWTDAVFQTGEATTIELCGVFNRYHAPLARTVMLGEPPHRLAAMSEVLSEGMPRTLEAMVPGASGGEVHRVFDAVLQRNGMTKESRIGYSIGIGYPPDWGERTVSLRSEETTVLQPGMAFHVILGMWMDGWGYELSEPVVITESGAERLCQLPQLLTIKR